MLNLSSSIISVLLFLLGAAAGIALTVAVIMWLIKNSTADQWEGFLEKKRGKN